MIYLLLVNIIFLVCLTLVSALDFVHIVEVAMLSPFAVLAFVVAIQAWRKRV